VDNRAVNGIILNDGMVSAQSTTLIIHFFIINIIFYK